MMRQTLVLNLASEPTRLAFQLEQAQRLGLECQRIPAVTPDTVDPAPGDPYWTTWERPLRLTEMAALCTHQLAWQHVVSSGVPALILEDDAILHPAVSVLLDQIGDTECFEHVTFETRGRHKLIGKKSVPDLPLHRLWLDRSGAAAYHLHPLGAVKLLSRAAQTCGLADAVICAASNLHSWQAVPALAVQFDMAEQHGVSPPFPAASTITTEPRPQDQTPGQRWRRAVHQVRMGLNHLRPGTSRIMLGYRSE